MFSIDITNPHANWIEIQLQLGDRLVQFPASSVLNDPIRELADLGLFIAIREPGTLGARFWLEPAGYELQASWRPALVLGLYEADEADVDLKNPRLVVERRVDDHTAALKICGCLLKVQALFAGTRFAGAQSWRHEFPAARVAELADATATRR